jgi:hypothetical protein
MVSRHELPQFFQSTVIATSGSNSPSLLHHLDIKLFIYEEEIEQVDSFTYLGSIVSKDGDADEDVRSRI